MKILKNKNLKEMKILKKLNFKEMKISKKIVVVKPYSFL
jgi:hypothetical protein